MSDTGAHVYSACCAWQGSTVAGYESYDRDHAGTLPVAGVWIGRIELRPRIVVTAGPTEERVRRLVELAHRECFIANSLRTDIAVEPAIEFAAP